MKWAVVLTVLGCSGAPGPTFPDSSDPEAAPAVDASTVDVVGDQAATDAIVADAGLDGATFQCVTLDAEPIGCEGTAATRFYECPKDFYSPVSNGPGDGICHCGGNDDAGEVWCCEP